MTTVVRGVRDKTFGCIQSACRGISILERPTLLCLLEALAADRHKLTLLGILDVSLVMPI